MWVVKLAGSLQQDPLLPEWLDLLARLGGGRVTLVCGGGGFGEEVRRSQGHWQLSMLQAHNMAVLAMAQMACLAQALQPALQLARNAGEIHRALHTGRTAVWLPIERLQDRADADRPPLAGADALALDLARRLNAERMVLVQSGDPLSHPPLGEADPAELAASGSGTGFPIDVVQRGDLERVRSLLIGEVRLSGA